jgi:hypothetical protein
MEYRQAERVVYVGWKVANRAEVFLITTYTGTGKESGS